MSILRSRRLLIGAGIVIFFALVAIIGPFFAGDPLAFSRAEWQPPSATPGSIWTTPVTLLIVTASSADR